MEASIHIPSRQVSYTTKYTVHTNDYKYNTLFRQKENENVFFSAVAQQNEPQLSGCYTETFFLNN